MKNRFLSCTFESPVHFPSLTFHCAPIYRICLSQSQFSSLINQALYIPASSFVHSFPWDALLMNLCKPISQGPTKMCPPPQWCLWPHYTEFITLCSQLLQCHFQLCITAAWCISNLSFLNLWSLRAEAMPIYHNWSSSHFLNAYYDLGTELSILCAISSLVIKQFSKIGIFLIFIL